MQTALADFIKNTPEGREADEILRSCVHCGFCTATCPTYQLTGNELDGPRGRIYLIKQLLEGQGVGPATQSHLDRCLTCRSCETTCPSGVQYGRLADIGRGILEKQVPRDWWQRLTRLALRWVMPYPHRFGPLFRAARLFRPLLPAVLRAKIPPAQSAAPWPTRPHPRKVLMLDGCVQPTLAPSINAAAALVLDRLKIQTLRPPGSGCCGALSYHLAAHEEGKIFMRRNIDAWWPHVQAGAEAIVITASGCGTLVKEYGHLLRDDRDYAEKAARIAELTRDISEVLLAEDWSKLDGIKPRRIAFHSPCTLQHGLRMNGRVESLLENFGFILTPVADAHLCCGSAGTYSILQPDMSQQLLTNKLAALEGGGPELIATANIGCLAHLQSAAGVPVRHWIELLASGQE